jgi:hypothetical protein
MRLTRKLKQQYIDRAKEAIFKLTGIHVSNCMVLGDGPTKVTDFMTQSMAVYSNGTIVCCVEGDRYYTSFYCDKLPDWLSNPCTDGMVSYPDAAIPKEKYDALEAIAKGDISIRAVVEWNMMVEEYNCKKLKRQYDRRRQTHK